MILATALNSSQVPFKAIAAPETVASNLPQGAGAPAKASVFSKALTAATSATVAKRTEKTKSDRGAQVAASSPAQTALPAGAVGVNTLGLATSADPVAAEDFPGDLTVAALAGSSGYGASSPESSSAGTLSLAAVAPANPSLAITSSTNTALTIAETAVPTAYNGSAAGVLARAAGPALAAELQANLTARSPSSTVPTTAGSRSAADGRGPIGSGEAQAGGPFDSVNSLAARIASPVNLKNATTSLESYAALAGQRAKSVAPIANRGLERVDETAERSVAAPHEVNLQNTQAANLNGNSTSTAALPSIENQRAISDVRQSLVGQLESKLQGEVDASAPQAATGINAINGKDTAPAGQAGSQGGTQAGSSGSGEQKHGDSQNGGAGDGDGLTATLADGDLANASKLVEAGTTAVSATHGAENVAATFGATLATAASVDSSSGAGSAATAEKAPPPPPQPLPLPFAEAARPADAVKASEIYQRVDGSEMHVAMQTDLLGAVDLRATMHQSGLTATISVQRSDVQSVLSSELPALQHALSDRNLHVEQISILNNSVHERAAGNGSAPQQQHPNGGGKPPANQGMPQPPRAVESLREALGAASATNGAQPGGAGYGRISVHA